MMEHKEAIQAEKPKCPFCGSVNMELCPNASREKFTCTSETKLKAWEAIRKPPEVSVGIILFRFPFFFICTLIIIFSGKKLGLNNSDWLTEWPIEKWFTFVIAVMAGTVAEAFRRRKKWSGDSLYVCYNCGEIFTG